MNILSVGWMLKASYQLLIIGKAAFTRKLLGEWTSLLTSIAVYSGVELLAQTRALAR